MLEDTSTLLLGESLEGCVKGHHHPMLGESLESYVRSYQISVMNVFSISLWLACKVTQAERNFIWRY